MAFYPIDKHFNDPTPVDIYLQHWQFRVRIGLGVIASIFIIFAPLPPFLINRIMVLFIGTLYCSIHIMWWRQVREIGPTLGYVRRSAWLDIFSAAFCVLVDPFALPPSLPLLLLATLANGLQFGVRLFFQLSSGAFALASIALAVRAIWFAHVPGYELVFYCLFNGICLYYAYLLFHRIEQLKQQAEQLGARDPLTGLYNRRAFQQTSDYVYSLQRRTKIQLVLMFADLDNFKPINDRLGHAFGDNVLQRFATIAQHNLRSNDIAARYGGDEFIFLLTDSDLEGAQHVALRLQHEFSIWAGEQDLNLSVSIGIGEVFPDYNQNSADLIQAVDNAMYRAKQRKGEPGVEIATEAQMKQVQQKSH